MNIQDLKLGLSVCLTLDNTLCRAIGYFPGFHQSVRLEKYNYKTGEFGAGILEQSVQTLSHLQITRQLLEDIGFKQVYRYNCLKAGTVIVPPSIKIEEDYKGNVAYCPYTSKIERVYPEIYSFYFIVKNNRKDEYKSEFNKEEIENSVKLGVKLDISLDVFLSNEIYFNIKMYKERILIGFIENSDKIDSISNYIPIGKQAFGTIQSFIWDICGTDVFSYHPILNKLGIKKLE